LALIGAIGPKSTTVSPVAAIFIATLAPPSAVASAAVKVNVWLFQPPTRHGSSPLSGDAFSGPEAEALGTAAASAAAEDALIVASLALGVLLQASKPLVKSVSTKRPPTGPMFIGSP
jgi:hypothetical protein